LTRQPQPNARGWNNTSVTVTLSCTDKGSGLKAEPSPVTFNDEGANQSREVVVEDRAGNKRTLKIGPVSIDKTPPVASPTVNPTPASGWTNGSITVSFGCSDALGFQGCAPMTFTGERLPGPVDIQPDVLDNADNRAAKVTVNLPGSESKAPACSETQTRKVERFGGRAGKPSATYTTVTVQMTCTDVGPSGIAEFKYKVNTEADTAVSGSSASYTVSPGSSASIKYWATDKAGNRTERQLQVTAPIDFDDGQSLGPGGGRP
jgi:hypothetical protein